MVCGYDSDLSLASYSDFSSPLLDLRRRELGKPLAGGGGQRLSSEQASGLWHLIDMGQWNRVAAWLKRTDGRLERKE